METVIYGVLKEEKERNLLMQVTYKHEIESLRKGSIITKKVSGKSYYYLKYRDGNKVKDEYIGPDKAKMEEIALEIARRKHLQGVLKRLKAEYKQICRIVKEDVLIDPGWLPND